MYGLKSRGVWYEARVIIRSTIASPRETVVYESFRRCLWNPQDYTVTCTIIAYGSNNACCCQANATIGMDTSRKQTIIKRSFLLSRARKEDMYNLAKIFGGEEAAKDKVMLGIERKKDYNVCMSIAAWFRKARA